MSQGHSGQECSRPIAGPFARVFLAQSLFIGATTSLCGFLTAGVNPRSVGFAAFGCAAAGLLLLACRGRGAGEVPAARSRASLPR